MNKKTAFEIAKALNTQTRLTPGEEGIRAARADANRNASTMSGLKETPEDWNGRALAALRNFFQPGRNQHGGVFSLTEDVLNAIERNLSLHTDDELLQFIAACNQFKQYVGAEIDSRRA